MMKLTSVAVAILVAMPFARVARADDALAHTLSDAIQTEEDRARDSATEVTTDEGLVAEIGKTIPPRLQRAEQADARAQAFRNAASALRRRGRNKLANTFDNLARAELTFAKNDRLEASERKRALDILNKQAAIAKTNLELHKRHADELRAQLEIVQGGDY